MSISNTLHSISQVGLDLFIEVGSPIISGVGNAGVTVVINILSIEVLKHVFPMISAGFTKIGGWANDGVREMSTATLAQLIANLAKVVLGVLVLSGFSGAVLVGLMYINVKNVMMPLPLLGFYFFVQLVDYIFDCTIRYMNPENCEKTKLFLTFKKVVRYVERGLFVSAVAFIQKTLSMSGIVPFALAICLINLQKSNTQNVDSDKEFVKNLVNDLDPAAKQDWDLADGNIWQFLGAKAAFHYLFKDRKDEQDLSFFRVDEEREIDLQQSIRELRNALADKTEQEKQNIEQAIETVFQNYAQFPQCPNGVDRIFWNKLVNIGSEQIQSPRFNQLLGAAKEVLQLPTSILDRAPFGLGNLFRATFIEDLA